MAPMIDDAPVVTAAPRGRRVLRWIVGGVLVLVVVVYGAIFLYAKVLNDAPDALDESDLGAALTGAADGQPLTADDVAGRWKVIGDSEFGYRVDEVLAGVSTTAVGRSNDLDGSLTIEGTAVTAVDISVEVETITSDEPRRDTHFRERVMHTDEFPTATFVLTEPIELTTIPAIGETVTAPATGELTLRAVTREVTFDVTAQVTGGRIGVLGSIPVVFDDYDLRNPSMPGVNLDDHGTIEFVLVFER